MVNSLRLVPEKGGSPLTVEQDSVLIGRDAICELQLADVSVSRKHAEIRRDGDGWVVRDLNSANGLMVDGVSVPRSPLRSGQRLQFGTVGVRVEIESKSELEGATVVLERPEAREKSPKTPNPRAAKAKPTHAVRPPPASLPPRRSRGPALALGGLFAVVVLGVMAWLRLLNPTEPRREAIPTRPATQPISESKANPSNPASAIAGPRGTVEVTTDTGALVYVDGEKKTELEAGGTGWIEVAPGEHVVTFGVGRLRRDVTVRVKANQQTVARFAAGAPTASVSASASPRVRPQEARPVAAVASTIPRARPQRLPTAPAPPPAPVVQPRRAPPVFTDEGLVKGAGLAARGDFYRAVLLLNGAVDRLEDDASGRPQLAYANAYLAWAYQGLNRADEARAAADRAMRADPGIAGGLDTFPAPVIGLFKRAR